MISLPPLTRVSSCSTRAPRRPRANLLSCPRVTQAVPICAACPACSDMQHCKVFTYAGCYPYPIYALYAHIDSEGMQRSFVCRAGVSNEKFVTVPCE